MRLENSAAIVTGGASGLGEATARMLAEAGARVAIFDLSEERGEQVAREIGGRFIRTNVTSEDEVSAALDQVDAAFGLPRVLVNCAGIGGRPTKTVSRGQAHPLDEFRRVIEVNLIGTFNCISKTAARMVAADPVEEERGVIISTASVAAFDGQVGQVSYAASKAAVAGMTLPIARDLSDKGIRVAVIAPGLFLTPMMMGLPQDVQNSLGRQTPFPSRLGRPSEYALLAKSIIENPMLNGEVIRLDGALRMAPR